MPIDPPLTSDMELASALPSEPVTVPKASPSMLVPGLVVAAPTAPLSGPIPDGHLNVVVQVKEWFESSTIWVSICGLFLIGLDAIVEGLITMEGPIQWKPLLGRALIAVGLAYQAMRRKSVNSVIR